MPPDYGQALRAPGGPQQVQQAQQAPMQGGQSPAMMNRADPAAIQRAIEQQDPNARQRLAEQYNSLSDQAAKDKFLENWFADWTAKADFAQQDMDQATALRQDMPEGRSTRGIYRAAHPLEFLGQGMNNYQQMKKYGAAKDARSEALQGATDARTQYANISGG